MTTEAEVFDYLRAHPGFLAAHPALFATLAPPARVHGPALADHMAAMVLAGRREVARVVEAGRARQSLGARVNEAVLALLRSPAPLDCVAEEWPGLLAMESVRLLAAETARVMLRDVADATLHGEAAPLVTREALVPVGPGTTLLLGARDAALLPAQAPPLAFLGRALAARLEAA